MSQAKSSIKGARGSTGSILNRAKARELLFRAVKGQTNLFLLHLATIRWASIVDTVRWKGPLLWQIKLWELGSMEWHLRVKWSLLRLFSSLNTLEGQLSSRLSVGYPSLRGAKLCLLKGPRMWDLRGEKSEQVGSRNWVSPLPLNDLILILPLFQPTQFYWHTGTIF